VQKTQKPLKDAHDSMLYSAIRFLIKGYG